MSQVEVSMATKNRLGRRWCRRQPPRALSPTHHNAGRISCQPRGICNSTNKLQCGAQSLSIVTKCKQLQQV